MIPAKHALSTNTDIDSVWSYVKDMQQWAAIFSGYRECVVVDDDNSKWVIKVGPGGLVRIVTVLVHVDKWQVPGVHRVFFPA